MVLSSLHHASRRAGHDLRGEIATLTWFAFFANALLVVLQLSKPDPPDTNGASVYVLADSQDGTPVTTGWQAFWAGDEPIELSTGGAGSVGRGGGRAGGSCFLCCCGLGFLWQRGRCCRRCCGTPNADDADVYRSEARLDRGVWPTVGGPEASATINDSLLGSIAFGGGLEGETSLYRTEKQGGGARKEGCMPKAGRFLCSFIFRRKSVPDREDEDSLRRQQLDTTYRESSVGGAALSVGAGTLVRPRIGRARSDSSSAYSVSSRARAPPQAAAPVFGASVTRWRLVNADGIPLTQHGLPPDPAWTDRSTDRSSERSFSVSFHTATTLGESDTITHDEKTSSSSSSPIAVLGKTTASSGDGDAGGPLRVQFGLSVRASGRGEMDWWGRDVGTPANSVASTSIAGATAAGDWRVWRSSADVLALYDALALHFGQEFCARVSRPQLKTAKISRSADGAANSDEDMLGLQLDRAPAQSNAPHRVDISSDARAIGRFLRTLLGLRQFLR